MENLSKKQVDILSDLILSEMAELRGVAEKHPMLAGSADEAVSELFELHKVVLSLIDD